MVAAASIAAGAAIAAKTQSEVQKTKHAADMERYRNQVHNLLNDSLREIQVAGELGPESYRLQVRPKLQRMLGRLEVLRSPEGKVNDRHDRLVRDFRRLLVEFDDAMTR